MFINLYIFLHLKMRSEIIEPSLESNLKSNVNRESCMRLHKLFQNSQSVLKICSLRVTCTIDFQHWLAIEIRLEIQFEIHARSLARGSARFFGRSFICDL